MALHMLGRLAAHHKEVGTLVPVPSEVPFMWVRERR